MKLKSLQQNHNVIVLIERYEQYIRLYFADGHTEIADIRINEYIHKNKGKPGYKHAIMMNQQNLYPTLDQKNKKCQWINVHYFEASDGLYFRLLRNKDILQRAMKIYLKEKLKMHEEA